VDIRSHPPSGTAGIPIDGRWLDDCTFVKSGTRSVVSWGPGDTDISRWQHLDTITVVFEFGHVDLYAYQFVTQ
jgi:hypothetical protein